MVGFLVNCNFLYFPDRVIFWYPYSSTSTEWGLRRVVPAATVTTHAKPHARQQLARDLEVERAHMGQRCRPQSSARCSEAIRSHVDGWISSELQLCCCTATKKAVRDFHLIPTYHTGRAALSYCRPLMSDGRLISIVCSRSGVRLYAATPRSGPGLLLSLIHI